METVLLREITMQLKDISSLEWVLRSHGFKNFVVNYRNRYHATVVFDTEEDATIFILKDILQEIKDSTAQYGTFPDFDFMIRLEKKLKSYSKCDEFFIRQKVKDT